MEKFGEKIRPFVYDFLGDGFGSQAITLFSVWHFLYLFVILAATITLAVLYKKKTVEQKTKLLNILAVVCISFYIMDFFLMPLSNTYDNKISQDKLPFHICTLMCCFVPFVQFNKKFAPIKGVITMLTITSSTMWMTYPGSALRGQTPLSYQVFQTFMFHGFIFCWSFLTIALTETKPSIKTCWHDIIGILVIIAWAAIGNILYMNQDWFFLTGSTFPFFPPSLMPLVVLVCVFAVDLAIYGVYYLTVYSMEQIKIKQTAREALQN